MSRVCGIYADQSPTCLTTAKSRVFRCAKVGVFQEDRDGVPPSTGGCKSLSTLRKNYACLFEIPAERTFLIRCGSHCSVPVGNRDGCNLYLSGWGHG